MRNPLLPEVPEAEATGTVAEVYEDIRRVLGLPLVNLIYRHLAVAPGRLEAVWAELRPNLADQAIEVAAQDLLAVANLAIPPISRATLSAVGVTGNQPGRVLATLDAYNRANSRNLIAIQGLIGLGGAGDRGRDPTGSNPGVKAHKESVEAGRSSEPDLLPIADLGRLDPPVVALLQEMAEPFGGRGEQMLVPGLFRHFADNAALLALLWTALRPSIEGRALARQGNQVAHRARALAAGLPHPVGPVEELATRAVLLRFAPTLSRMLVAGSALARALR